MTRYSGILALVAVVAPALTAAPVPPARPQRISGEYTYTTQYGNNGRMRVSPDGTYTWSTTLVGFGVWTEFGHGRWELDGCTIRLTDIGGDGTARAPWVLQRTDVGHYRSPDGKSIIQRK